MFAKTSTHCGLVAREQQGNSAISHARSSRRPKGTKTSQALDPLGALTGVSSRR